MYHKGEGEVFAILNIPFQTYAIYFNTVIRVLRFLV